MNISEKIERAFVGRRIPYKVLDLPVGRSWLDSDEEETLWFQDRDRHDITWEEWAEHDPAISFFTPQAFAYYLPSVLLLSLQRPEQWFSPAHTLMFQLRRYNSVASWDEHFRSRFFGLRTEELDALKECYCSGEEMSITMTHRMQLVGPSRPLIFFKLIQRKSVRYPSRILLTKCILLFGLNS